MMTAPNDAPLYIRPLNKVEEGPFTIEEAIAAARKHLYVSPADASRIAEDYRAGSQGPWHVVYGFFDCTIRVGSDLRLAA
ncbi:hypothetical protein [uncultured Jannaschia sp.]|uniref:hypothetical protein n=1 Tax=uncultured Jannaschia sp. TaxID=293347 RepID=UPI0026019A96|nr:hypothetical protein [uncultured Jannaschia sp.]